MIENVHPKILRKMRPCKDKQGTDCFARQAGKCKLLLDTDFGKRVCPFYTTRLNAIRGWEKYGYPLE